MDDKNDKNDIIQNKPRNIKLKELGLDEKCPKKDISDKVLDTLYKKFINEKKENDKNIKNKIKNNDQKGQIYIKKTKMKIKVDKESEQYKITLEFLNTILTTMEKEQINDITEFKDINRNNLIKDECKKIVDDYLERIIKQFGKTKIAYRNRNTVDHYIISLIKYMAINCGYSFKSHNVFESSADKPGTYTVVITYSIID